MALIPSRTKFRKSHRGSRAGNASRGTKVDFGEYGLQSLGRAWITSQQIEACRVAINRALKRKGKVWIRIFPHKPITKRPPETRMGKGKGALNSGWRWFVQVWFSSKLVVQPSRWPKRRSALLRPSLDCVAVSSLATLIKPSPPILLR